MSWRALIIFLLLAVVASWQGGKQLGQWLIEQAPDSIASTVNPTDSGSQALDAEGKPLAPQPPQPRIDGTLGVPRDMEPIEWTIAAVLASSVDANAYDKDGEGSDDNDADSPDGDQDTVRTLDVSSASAIAAPPRSVPVTPTATETWQQALTKELTRCNSVTFFRRPGCIDAAQVKFCGPNNAWGKVTGCPARSTDTPVGG